MNLSRQRHKMLKKYFIISCKTNNMLKLFSGDAAVVQIAILRISLKIE